MDGFLALQISHALPQQQRPKSVWRPPPLGQYRINFNKASFATKNMSSIRVVIRDNRDLVIASLSQQLPQAYLAVEIEALVVAKALNFALELGIVN